MAPPDADYSSPSHRTFITIHPKTPVAGARNLRLLDVDSMNIMNLFNVQKKDLKVLLLIRPPFMALMCYVFFGQSFFTDSRVFLFAGLAAVITILASWRVHIYADHFFRRRFHHIRHLGRRLCYSVASHFLIAAGFISFLAWAAHQTQFLGYRFSYSSYLPALFVGFCTNLTATGFHEGVYIFENWVKTSREAEEVKKINLRNRLMGLQSQINPHFLFNSINTLSGLIESDTDKADRFLDEMCIVYRYLLKNEPEQFVPLHAELDFIRSWIYIMETRYGRAICFNLQNLAHSSTAVIPRLTILVFLESIINTNVADKNNPLSICLYNAGDNAIGIRYPVLKKRNLPVENKTQQTAQVKTMYRILGLPEIAIKENNGMVHILLPLRNPEPDTAV